MSHQRANSTSSVSTAFPGGMVGFPPSSAARGDLPPTSHPGSIAIPRQRSFSSSFSFATSPRTFTGSSIISNPNNPLLVPASPTSVGPAIALGTTSNVSTSQTMPVLHRRFSSSFNQLNQIVISPPSSGNATERGRRTSMFGGSGSSPPMSMSMPAGPTSHPQAHSLESTGLFRKLSLNGRSGGHPLDSNETDLPGGLAPEPNLAAAGTGRGQTQHALITAVDKLKPPQDSRPSRSNSPMRSLILGGQMLD
ncbi:hypothetical protein BGZ94_005349 [Podila epigama]|nr:hypothetical protein BGZ94_005349 [Podila epigama]